MRQRVINTLEGEGRPGATSCSWGGVWGVRGHGVDGRDGGVRGRVGVQSGGRYLGWDWDKGDAGGIRVESGKRMITHHKGGDIQWGT